MKILLVAEHDGKNLKSGTLSTLTAAAQLNGTVHVLLAGSALDELSAQAKQLPGVEKILVADDASLKDFLAEPLTALLVTMGKDYDFIVAPASTFGKNVMPRVAALLDVQQISDVIAVESATRFVRPIYAGNALQTVETAQAKNILTVRPSAFAATAATGGQASVEKISVPAIAAKSKLVSREETKLERPELASARVVVSGGRALGSKENFKIIEELADALGGAVGASRAAVDAGYVPNDYQVGQTGKIVAPDLYIAVGISGAIQHQAGMTGSKTVVAINKDPDAPIFQIADYGLVADLFTVVPELVSAIKS